MTRTRREARRIEATLPWGADRTAKGEEEEEEDISDGDVMTKRAEEVEENLSNQLISQIRAKRSSSGLFFKS